MKELLILQKSLSAHSLINNNNQLKDINNNNNNVNDNHNHNHIKSSKSKSK